MPSTQKNSTTAPRVTAGTVTCTWAKGLTVNGNSISGYFDADKDMTYGEDGDAFMCWAGTASSMLAWWQHVYNLQAATNSDFPTDVEEIFDIFVDNWTNVGNSVSHGLKWWLTGKNFSGYNGSDKAGYFRSLYTAASVEDIVDSDYVYIGGKTYYNATQLTSAFARELRSGSIIALGIAGDEGSHALTLYGIEEDSATGYLTALYISDSNDHHDSVFRVAVHYDPDRGCYELQGNSSYIGWYIDYFGVLRAFNKTDTAAPARPSGLSARVEDQFVTFSWTSSDESGVFYEIRLGSNDYRVASGDSLTISLKKAGTYTWSLRAIDAVGNASAWVQGSAFTCKVTPPTITLDTPKLVTVGKDKSTATFSWSAGAATGLRYELWLDGECVYSGAETSCSATLADGVHTYSVAATNAAGIRSMFDGGLITCDTIAPPTPTQLKVSIEGNQATLSWGGAQDHESYVLWYGPGGDRDTYVGPIRGQTSCTVTLPCTGEYSWSVAAQDAADNLSGWAWGSFTYGVQLHQPLCEKLSIGLSRVTFSWECEENSSYRLTVDGKTYDAGKNDSYTLELRDGSHSYTVTNSNGLSSSGSLTCDTTPPALPRGLSIHRDGAHITFSWEAAADEGEVRYDFRYGPAGGAAIELRENISETSCTFALPAAGEYSWMVRARDNNGNESAWASGESFSYNDSDLLRISLDAPVLTREAEGRTRVLLSWSCSEAATYQLRVDDMSFDLGAESRYELSLPDGEHHYTVIAVNRAGNSSLETGSFACDATAPTRPQGLAVQLQQQETQAHFQWNPAQDANSVRYEFRCRPVGQGAYHYEELTGTELTLPLTEDAGYEWALRAVDSVGNATAWVAGAAFTRDTTAPAMPPPGEAPETGATSATLRWEAAGDASAVSYDLRYRPAGSRNAWSTRTTRATSLKIEGLTKGFYEWEIRATDDHGNASRWLSGPDFEVGGLTSLLRMNAPVLTPAGKNKVTATLSWTGKAGARYTLYVDNKVVLRNKSTTTWQGKVGDGTHRYELYATDGDGTTTLNGHFSCDARAPKLTLTSPRFSNSGRLSWESDEEATYSLTVGKQAAPAYTGAETACTLTLAEGKHSYSITATDAKGNSSTVKGSITIDTTAPTLTLKSYKLKANKKTGAWNATLSWKGESGCTYTLLELRDGGTETLLAQGSKTSHKLSLQQGQAIRFVVLATDKAGNTTRSAERVLREDTSAPLINLLGHRMTEGDDHRALTTFSWTCTELGGSDFSIKVDGRTVKNASIVEHADGSYSYTHTAPLKGGRHSYSITATDWAGNKTTVSGRAFSTPELTLSKPRLSRGSAAGLMQATLAWKAEADTTYTLSVDGGRAQTICAPPGSKTATHVLTDIRDGAHVYRVTATNAEGCFTVAEGQFSHDTTAPDIIIGAISGSAVYRKGETFTRATLGWVGEEGVRYTVTVDGKKLGVKKLTETVTLNGRKTSVTRSTLGIITGRLEAGEHLYCITARDKAGNVSEYSGSFTCEDGAAEWPGGTDFSDTIPEGAQALCWQAEDTAGVAGAAAAGYSFELTEARQLVLRLTGPEEDATIYLQQLGGQGHITLRANAGVGLDRELTLSAGSYYLQVRDATGAAPLTSACMLDLELEKQGRKPLQQATLAGRA